MDSQDRTHWKAIRWFGVAAVAATLLVGAPLRGDGRGEERRERGMHASQLAALRGATARFHRLDVALAEGYTAFGGCFADPGGAGGMGYHYVNADLVADPAIDPLRPELLVYAPQPNGELQLAAVEWITFVAAWHNAGNHAAPALFGHEFHVNPTLLNEPFYLLHAWIWRHNPSGILANWNPTVRCP
jgi:hypothetical protein